MSDTITEEVVEEVTELGNKKYAHIVSPPENPRIYQTLVKLGVRDPGAREIVEAARRMGWEVKAICGYVFIPLDDPEAYDACQICMDVAGMHMRNAGE